MTVKEIGHFQDEVQTHRPLAGIEEGSDGKIYIAGEYYRTREGGGLAIYDPLTEEKDGVIIEDHRPHWMTSIDSGDYMILSSKSEDGLGVLGVYDVMEKRLTFHRPNDDIYPGYVVGVAGTHFIGYGRSDVYGPVIYRYDPIERQLYWIKSVPYDIRSSSSDVRGLHSIMLYDNGYIYTIIDQALVEIDINSAQITVLGRLPSPNMAILVDGTFYQAGYEGFAKLIFQ
jgi:hypothetical protein